jgi:hypothetical protein
MLDSIRANAAIIQAIVALLGVIVAGLLLVLARQQTKTGRLNAFREILWEHQTPEMRERRRIVRNELIAWLKSHEILDEKDPKWIELKGTYEDVLNYYEYLGALLRERLADEDIILRAAHNSAVAIWDIYQRYGDRIRPPATRAPDYADEFKYLVERAKEYRKNRGLDAQLGSKASS